MQFAEIIYSEVLLSLRQLVAGQVSSKQIKGVSYKRDSSHGMERIEVLCKRCDSHLGHVLMTVQNLQECIYCMNSVSLDFQRDSEKNSISIISVSLYYVK